MSDAVRLFSSDSSETVAGSGPEILNSSPEAQSKQASNLVASTFFLRLILSSGEEEEESAQETEENPINR